jgi:alpha-glucosidase (family GH31 glycosyl hydrolase)
LQYARDLLEHGFPPGVLMIDDNWQSDYGEWSFHSGRFTDPKAMLDELHRLGFLVMLWVCPFVSPDSLTFRQIEGQGLLLKDKDGQTVVRRWWNGHSGVLDLSNPAAVGWFNAQLDRLINQYGVDGFKLDAGDPVFYRPDDQYHAPSSPADQCRRYSEIGLRYPLNEYRAAWKMGGQPLAQRQRDKAHAWDKEHPQWNGLTGLSSVIPDAITQGLLGYAYNCPDMIGGGDYLALDFSSESASFDSELFVRSAQAATLMPMMQFSAAPWRLLNPEQSEICRQMAWLHVEHGAKILGLAQQAAHSGEPILRSMEYVFPHQGYAGVKDQFMLGDDLLVAPMLKKGATSRTVRLPKGSWRGDDETTYTSDGTQAVTVAAGLERLPRFTRVQSPMEVL